jgi:hypothetical protein
MRKAMFQGSARRTGQTGRWGLSLLLAIILAVPVTGQETPAKPAEPGRTLGPLEKSLLLPGWGQLSEKHVVEGILFLAAEAGAIAAALVNNHRGNESYALYRGAETLEEAVRARELTERYDIRRNQLLLAAAAVWAANLIDISLIVKKKGPAKEALSLRIGLGTKDHFGLTARCRF